ncbi:LmeA family phospholipid-binding protein [Nocardiopsis alba]|uniref:LmeA family phospholipid-binding protein n=1 Tax=Nocardiopsis alba TaxID=53437 RepID=UPI0035D76188
MRKFLVVLLILLAALVVVADIGARSFAQGTLSERLAQQMDMSEEPDVSIEGWAFLPQVLSGTYTEVNIDAASATMSGVTVEQVEATASDVEAPLSDLLNEPDVVAGQVDGSFVVPYTYFNPYLPEGMTISTEEGDARISGELALTELGRSIPVSSGVEFTVDGDVLTVTPVDIQIGDLPIDLGDQVADALGFSAQVPELPLGLSVTEMEATSSGLRITGTGSDIPLMGSEVA